MRDAMQRDDRSRTIHAVFAVDEDAPVLWRRNDQQDASYSVVLRVRKVREAAEPAAIEAFQTALNLANAKEEAAAARRDAPATPETAQPDMNYVDQSGENRSD